MPLSRLVESFDFSSNQFDVVIIDEASQCDVMALLALAISQKVIIVGDDKQVSPLAVGQDLTVVDKLIKMHLEGIPLASLYDGRRSIYNVAKPAFPGHICLLEHFRCVPDIIQFSNDLCYEGKIRPLRGKASSQLRPHVVSYRVEGACRGQGNVNCEEASHIASLIVAACEHPAFSKETFGVVSLLGAHQAIEIERLLRKHLPTEEYETRRILCGNSAHFQGDERGVMFLSMVDSPSSGPLRLRQRKDFQRRYNVAASRAQNQMWVVHSLNYQSDLQPGDLRRRLIEHAMDPGAATRELEKAQSRTDSPFEKEVYERLVRRGYRPECQWWVGYYRIDFAFPHSMVAIECDGDRYHPIEKLPEDMARQAVLERLGWKFIRIRGSVFFRDRDAAMIPVFERLKELDVSVESLEVAGDPQAATDGRSVVDEVVRRAAQLRAEWQEPEPVEGVVETPSNEPEENSVSGSVAGSGRHSRQLVDASEEAEATLTQHGHEERATIQEIVNRSDTNAAEETQASLERISLDSSIPIQESTQELSRTLRETPIDGRSSADAIEHSGLRQSTLFPAQHVHGAGDS
ncbi:MAG: AAA domain-containing protein, partial [Thermomicrobiales bacterium]